MAAPLGNKNASQPRLWQAAIRRALEAKSRREGIEALDKVAEALLKKAEEGDLEAIKVLGDRLDGKAAQQQIISGDEYGGPVQLEVVWQSKDG